MLQPWFKVLNSCNVAKGLLRYEISVRLDFDKKYGTELRTEFLEKVRYRTEIRYYIFRTVHFSCSSNTRFAFLPPSNALFFLAYDQGRIQGGGRCGGCIPSPAIFNNALDQWYATGGPRPNCGPFSNFS